MKRLWRDSTFHTETRPLKNPQYVILGWFHQNGSNSTFRKAYPTPEVARTTAQHNADPSRAAAPTRLARALIRFGGLRDKL
ncbi:uncharacterized protein FFC1_01950 [Fusarium fujikuroi]|nr:uncharacterized protein FFC1_01950 [Fusarium fujikuroi]